MQDAKEMEFNYMTAACQILLGLGPAGHLIVVQEGFKISHLPFFVNQVFFIVETNMSSLWRWF